MERKQSVTRSCRRSLHFGLSASNVQENRCVHGSDSDENAEKEVCLFQMVNLTFQNLFHVQDNQVTSSFIDTVTAEVASRG